MYVSSHKMQRIAAFNCVLDVYAVGGVVRVDIRTLTTQHDAGKSVYHKFFVM